MLMEILEAVKSMVLKRLFPGGGAFSEEGGVLAFSEEGGGTDVSVRSCFFVSSGVMFLLSSGEEVVEGTVEEVVIGRHWTGRH